MGVNSLTVPLVDKHKKVTKHTGHGRARGDLPVVLENKLRKRQVVYGTEESDFKPVINLSDLSDFEKESSYGGYWRDPWDVLENDLVRTLEGASGLGATYIALSAKSLWTRNQFGGPAIPGFLSATVYSSAVFANFVQYLFMIYLFIYVLDTHTSTLKWNFKTVMLFVASFVHVYGCSKDLTIGGYILWANEWKCVSKVGDDEKKVFGFPHVGIPLWIKWFAICNQILMPLYIMVMGTAFLATSEEFNDLVMNSAGLYFIIELDEMFICQYLDKALKPLIDMLARQMQHNSHNANQKSLETEKEQKRNHVRVLEEQYETSQKSLGELTDKHDVEAQKLADGCGDDSQEADEELGDEHDGEAQNGADERGDDSQEADEADDLGAAKIDFKKKGKDLAKAKQELDEILSAEVQEIVSASSERDVANQSAETSMSHGQLFGDVKLRFHVNGSSAVMMNLFTIIEVVQPALAMLATVVILMLVAYPDWAFKGDDPAKAYNCSFTEHVFNHALMTLHCNKTGN